MPQAHLFVPQDAIEHWLGAGTARVDGETLSLEECAFALIPAVRVLREVAGGIDDHDLIGRVKTLDQLGTLGGEICAGSVVLGDCAFEVVEGFVARFTDSAGGAPPTHEQLVKMLSRR